MLYAKVVRSPYAHARIINIDTSRAEKLPGVRGVVRPEDVVLDFNHPLAGETLYFHVKIATLRPPTSEELTHGHVHDADDGH